MVVRDALVARLLGVQEARLDVFVVHADQAVFRGLAVDREVVDPVMVPADLVLLLRAGVGTRAEGGHVARDRRAGRGEDLEAVALRDHHGVVEADGNRLEADQAGGRAGQRRLAAHAAADQPGGDRGQAARHEAAAGDARLHDLVEIAVGGGVALRLVAVLVAHRLRVVGIVVLEVLHGRLLSNPGGRRMGDARLSDATDIPPAVDASMPGR